MRVFILALLSLFFLAPAVRAAAPAQDYSKAVSEAEHYLDGIETAQARFLQTSQDGAQAIGNFYLSRPGKLRFEYDDPIKDFIVADGFLIYFYDSEMGEQTNAPIGTTLADFILRPDLRFDGDLKVTDVTHGGGLLQVTLVQDKEPESGSITLGFSENPLTLKKWRITDSMGAITEIELFQLKTGVDLDRSLFVYKDPKWSGDGPRQYND